MTSTFEGVGSFVAAGDFVEVGISANRGGSEMRRGICSLSESLSLLW